MRFGQGWRLVGLLLLLMGCGNGASPEGPAGGGSGSSGAAGGGRGGLSGAGTGGEPVDDNPFLCGGAYPDECAEGKICRFQSGCGTVGHCTTISESCDDVSEPVCGCDGKTYGNECYARAARVSEGSPGECAETFACGPYRCAKGQYCLDKADQAKGPWRFGCLPLPEACGGVADCACLSDVKSCYGGSTCATVEGSAQVVCN